MKLKLRIVFLIWPAIIISLGVKFCLAAVTECYTCKLLHAKDCHTPVNNLSYLDKVTCGAEKPVLGKTNETSSGDATTPAAEEAPPPERVVELAGATKEYKYCIITRGTDNVTGSPTTFRGCSVGGCKERTMTTFSNPQCEECEKNLCNLSVTIKPIGGILNSLLISIICLVLDWGKSRI